MLNQVVLVGRLTSDLEAKELEDGKKVTNMTLAIPRSFKMLMENMKQILLNVLYGTV